MDLSRFLRLKWPFSVLCFTFTNESFHRSI
jgi:hypothetical protein